MVEIHGLTVLAGARTLVDGLTAMLPGGRVSVAVGPNGAGKSTLLRAMCAEVPFARGDVLLEGLSVRTWPPKKLALCRAVVGAGAPSEPPAPWRVRELLGIRRPRHCSCDPAQAAARKALELAGVAHLGERRWGELSRGEQQRVVLARALAKILDAGPGATRYLWLDEPLRGLDPAFRHHWMRVARGLAQAGASVFCILDDVEMAAAYADQVLVLSQGRLVTAGPPERALRPEILRRAFEPTAVQ